MLNKATWLTNEMKREFENFQSEKHKYMKPSLDAYMFFPTSEEIIEFDEKNPKASNRRYFEGLIEYNSYEVTKLKELKDAIEKFNKKQNKTNPINLNSIRDSDLLRFLQASSFDISKSIDMLNLNLEWKKVKIPQQSNETIMEILNTGLIYIHGRDCRFRPIINVSATVFEKYKNRYTFQDIEAAIIYLLQYILNFLLIPGQIENWVVILDLKDVYITSIPAELQKIIAVLLDNYPCRLFIMYLINISGNLEFLWGSIKPLLSVVTQRKMKLLKSSNLKDLLTYINPMHIEKKFGGNAFDLEGIFFPGYITKHECLLPGEKRSNVILDYESYSKLLKTKSKITMCPYIDTMGENNESDADDESNSSEDDSSSEKISMQQNNNSEKKVNRLNNNSESELKKFSSKFLKPVSSITQNDIFYNSFTNNFSMSKTEKIQDSQVEVEKKKLESGFKNLKLSKTINNNQVKKTNLRTSSFSHLMNDGIVINLNISNNMRDINTIKENSVEYEKAKSKSSSDGTNTNPPQKIPSEIKNNEHRNEDIKEENITKKTCCSRENIEFSSCLLF